MAEPIHFPGHFWAHCERLECYGCHLCHGGLAICKRCGGMEGSLPTDCPGEQMGEVREQAVYAGELDWNRSEGWVGRPSKHSPAYYKRDDHV